MSTVHELHDKAMDLAEKAFVGQHYHKMGITDHEHYKTPEQTKELNHQAMLLEKQAADMVEVGLEPTRGILYRSAGWLAIHAGELDEAVKLANKGLEGNPPTWLAGELNEVLEAVKNGN